MKADALLAGLRFAGVAAMVVAAALPARAGTLPPGTADLIATLLPETVAITAMQHIQNAKPAGPDDYTTKEFVGAGFIVDPSGLIVTNHHVVAGASELYATLSDHTRLKATLIYTSPIDLVLLKVNAARTLPVVKWGDSAKLRIGDPVLAIGNPLGVGTTVTAGIISALDRDIGQSEAETGQNLDAFLQTDAALNHGNSGGPLFDLNGELVGVDTALISLTASSAGLGFAIPSNDAHFVLDQYRKYGRVRPGYLGARVQALTPDMADSVGLAPARGVIVNAIAPGSPADGILRLGDIVLEIRGFAIADSRTMNRAVQSTPFGQSEPVTVWRDGRAQTLTITFAEAPDSQPAAMTAASPAAPAELKADDLGLSLAPVSDALRQQFRLDPAQQGVVVTRIVPHSLADNRGMKAGDVVIRVQDTAIATADDLAAAVSAARQAGRHHLLVLLQRGQDVRWIGVPLVSRALP